MDGANANANGFHPEHPLPPKVNDDPAAAISSSSLPTPPATTAVEHEHVPAPALAVEQPHAAVPLADSQAPAIPPPAVPLPPHLGLPAKLVHADSESSLAAQPPTPAPAAAGGVPPPPAVAVPAQYAPDPVQAPAQPQYAHSHEVNGAYEAFAEHTGAHPGLGSHLPPFEENGLNGHGGGDDDGEMGGASSVDVLADVAMGEAALGLADFAAGAGSGDVSGGSPALPPAAGGGLPELSPALKRSADDAAYGELSGMLDETAEEREAKRFKAEDEAPPVPTPAFDEPSPYPSAPAPLPAAPAVVEPSPAPSSSLPPASAPAPSPTPTPVAGFDPSAFTTAPTFASSAPPHPPPPPAAAPTMSPSDLHNFGQSPLGLPPASSSAPLPSPALPISAPSASPALYAAPDAFAQQHQPVASTSAAGLKPDPDAEGSPAPPEPAPMHIMTKEQQKFCINMVRNLKRNKNAPPFLKPVDAVALLVPDYYKIITHPMDLGTVEARLQATGRGMQQALKTGRTYGLDYSEGRDPAGRWEGSVPEDEEPKPYRTADEFKTDLDRIWANCFRYNGPREKNPVSGMAGAMQDAADKTYRSIPFAPAISPYPPKYVEPPKQSLPMPPRPAENTRPKREIHAPAKDLPYLESAGVDVTAGGIYNLAGLPGYGSGAPPPKKAKSAAKIAQEQMRFCKEVVKELYKKVHEQYAYPFYQPVDLASYPTYLQFVKKPMDLSLIRSKVEHNQYPSPPYEAFERDVRMIFQNCYAFNPPQTPVHEMGRRLEAIFEAKWAERPVAYEDDSDDEEDGLTAMEQQLNLLQQNIELMKANKKAQKEAKRFAQMQARMHAVPPPPPPMPKPQKKPAQQSPYNPYGQPAPAPPRPKKTSSSGPRPGGAPKKPKRRRDDDSDDYYEDDGGAYYGGGSASTSRRHTAAAIEPAMEEYVDFEMKRELAIKIVSFEGDQLEEAINIIRRGRPDLLGAANQEIELDIDQLDQRTLLALYRYVCPDSQPAVRPVMGGGAGGGGGGRAGSSKPQKQARNQRKNLDEEKEAARIEALEAQLAQFDNPTPGAPPADQSRRGSEAGLEGAGGVGGGEGGAGGDQASSDSSSDEGSDSESDEE
ncbi:transcription initiation at TATA-containing promoter protein [Rhodotorula kratochvilovae]